MVKKNKGYRNKGPKYSDRLGHIKKKIQSFFRLESKNKHGRSFKK